MTNAEVTHRPDPLARMPARLAPASPFRAPRARVRHGAVAAGLAVFVLVALDVHFGGRLTVLDRAVGQVVYARLEPATRALFADVVSFPGDDAVLLAVLAVGASALAGLGRWRTGLLLAASGLLAMGAVWTLKSFFAAERPSGFFDVTATVLPHLSFPSGHTTNTTIVYGLLAYLLTYAYVSRGGRPERGTRIFVLVGWLLVAFAMGLARVLGGVHWPTDVVAGWALAAAWLGASVTVHERWVRPFEQLAQGRRPSNEHIH